MKADDDAVGAVEIPIDGTLDLHTFHPRDLDTRLPEYFNACRERGVLDVRVVHGKGKGVLRTRVEAILARSAEVESYRRAGAGAGEWGATLVRLRPLTR